MKAELEIRNNLSDTQFTRYEKGENGSIVFKVELSRRDLEQVKLDPLDRGQIFDFEDEASDTPIADQILRLQKLVFRMEQQEVARKREQSRVILKNEEVDG